MTQYIYARTSTSDQNVEQQAELLQKAYPDSKLNLEKASATSMDRPILDALLHDLTSGDTIIVYDMSRLNRNTIDFLSLIERFDQDGINLVIHNMGGGTPIDTRTPVGKMILTVLMAAEQMSVQLMKEKQAIGIARGQAEGKYIGRRQSEKTVKACGKALRLIDAGNTKEDAARASEVGIATLYRYIKQHGLNEVVLQV